jgi:hypothetical protein
MIVDRCPDGGVCCDRCDRALEPGSLVMNVEPHPSNPRSTRHYFHLRCAIDVYSYWAKIALDVTAHEFAERDALRRLATEREEGRTRALRSRDAVEVEPATDPWGRPRVTALIAGSAFNQRSWDQFCAAVRHHTWRSSQREYVFAWIGSLAPWRDPSRPTTASIFAANVESKVVKAQLDRLTQCKSMGLPTPVLWLFGARASADREAYFRAQLDRAGFVGDASLIVYGPDELNARTVLDAAVLDPALRRARRAAVSALTGCARQNRRERCRPVSDRRIRVLACSWIPPTTCHSCWTC